MKIFYLTIGYSPLAFAGIAKKYGLKKTGNFAGTCASKPFFLNKDGEACGYCGKLPTEQELQKDSITHSPLIALYIKTSSWTKPKKRSFPTY